MSNTKKEIYEAYKQQERINSKLEGNYNPRGRGRPKKEPLSNLETSDEIASVTQDMVRTLIDANQEINSVVPGGLFFDKKRKDAKIKPAVWEFMEYWWAMGSSDADVLRKIGLSATTFKKFLKNNESFRARKEEVKKAAFQIADQNITLAVFKERDDLMSGKIKKPEISMWKAERDPNLKDKYQKTQHVVKEEFGFVPSDKNKAVIQEIFQVPIKEPDKVIDLTE